MSHVTTVEALPPLQAQLQTSHSPTGETPTLMAIPMPSCACLRHIGKKEGIQDGSLSFIHSKLAEKINAQARATIELEAAVLLRTPSLVFS